jgi:hypothetical protein
MRYKVVVPTIDTNGSESHPCLYSFSADSDNEAIEEFNKERRMYCQWNHQYSRLLSGGVFWNNAKLMYSGTTKEVQIKL